MLEKLFRKAQDIVTNAVTSYHETTFAEKGASAFAADCGWWTGYDAAERLQQQGAVPEEIMQAAASIRYDEICDAVQQQVVKCSKTDLKEFAFNNSSAVRYAFRELDLDWSSDVLAFIDTTEAGNEYRGLLITKRGIACNVTCDTPFLIPWSCFAACCAGRPQWDKNLFYLRFTPEMCYIFSPYKKVSAYRALLFFLAHIRNVLWTNAGAEELRRHALNDRILWYQGKLRSFQELGDAEQRSELKDLIGRVGFGECYALSNSREDFANVYVLLFSVSDTSDFLKLCQEVANTFSAHAAENEADETDKSLSAREQAAKYAAAFPALADAFNKLASAYDEECRLREEQQRQSLTERFDAFNEDSELGDLCEDLLDILECDTDEDLTAEEQVKKELERFPDLAERFDELCRQYQANMTNRVLRVIENADPDDPEALYETLLKHYERNDRFKVWWEGIKEEELRKPTEPGDERTSAECIEELFMKEYLPALKPNLLFAGDRRLYSPMAYYIRMYIDDAALWDEALNDYRERYMIHQLEKTLDGNRMEQRLQDIVRNDDVAAVEQDPTLLNAVDDLGMDLLLYTALYHGSAPNLVAYFAADPKRTGSGPHTNALRNGVRELVAFSEHYEKKVDYAQMCANLGDTEMLRRIEKTIAAQDRAVKADARAETAASVLSFIADLSDSVYKNATGDSLGAGDLARDMTSGFGSGADRQLEKLVDYLYESYDSALRSATNDISKYFPAADGRDHSYELEESKKIAAFFERMRPIVQRERNLCHVTAYELKSSLSSDKKVLESWIDHEVEKSVQDLEKDEFETSDEFGRRLRSAKEKKRKELQADLDRQRGELAPGEALPCVEQERARIRQALPRAEQRWHLQELMLNMLYNPIYSKYEQKKTLGMCYLRACCTPLDIWLDSYDADRELFKVKVLFPSGLGDLDLELPVQRSLARQFKSSFKRGTMTCDIDIDNVSTPSAYSGKISFFVTYRFGVHCQGIDHDIDPMTFPMICSESDGLDIDSSFLDEDDED